MNKGATIKFSHSDELLRASAFRKFEAEYKEMPPESKHWVASKGVLRMLLPVTTDDAEPDGGIKKTVFPPRESRFECLEYQNDDPKFTDAVFTIRLPKGTYIWDPRIQKDYRQGSDVEIRSPLPTERKLLFGYWSGVGRRTVTSEQKKAR